MADLKFRLQRGSGILGLLAPLVPSVAVPVFCVEFLMPNPHSEAASLVIAVGTLAIYIPPLGLELLAAWKLNYTKCSEQEIRTRRLIWTRRCEWSKVRDITVQRVSLSSRTPPGRGKIRAVRVHTTGGHSFLLGAPIDGGFKRDPDFDASLARIQAYWRTWRALHPGHHLWLYSWPSDR